MDKTDFKSAVMLRASGTQTRGGTVTFSFLKRLSLCRVGGMTQGQRKVTFRFYTDLADCADRAVGKESNLLPTHILCLLKSMKVHLLF